MKCCEHGTRFTKKFGNKTIYSYFAPKLGRKHKNETLADADADADTDGDGDGGDGKRHRRRGRGRGRDDEVTKHFFLRR
jgi:hypothetical protein